MVTMKKGRLETEWNTFDTLYTQWADTVDEQDIDQHHEGYEDIASAKDQALESATELISKDNILTWGQGLISKKAVDSAGMKAVLHNMYRKGEWDHCHHREVVRALSSILLRTAHVNWGEVGEDHSYVWHPN